MNIIKHFEEYVQSLNESANGLVLMKSSSKTKNYDIFLKYFESIDKKSSEDLITGDYSALELLKNDFGKYFADNTSKSKAIFYIKNRASSVEVCINGYAVEKLSDKQLYDDYSLEYRNNKYYLSNFGIDAAFEVTHKNSEKAKLYVKVWPDTLQTGKNEMTVGNTTYNFGNKGYILIEGSDLSNFGNIIAEHYKTVIDNDVIPYIFEHPENIEQILRDNKNDEYLQMAMANVLSEPLSVFAVINNINGVLDKIKNTYNNTGSLNGIIIPLLQNWPIADFYARFDNLEFLVPVSVKSNGSGNASTILSCLDTSSASRPTASQVVINEFRDFIDDIIPCIENKKEFSWNHTTDNLTEYLYEALLYGCKIHKYSKNKILEIFACFSQDIKDEYLKNIVTDVYNCQGTNFIERVCVSLFNKNSNIINEISTQVGKATSCHKVTVYSNGKIDHTLQSENGTLKLKSRAGGQSVVFNIENGKITEVSKGALNKQGQWFGYTFK